MMTSAVSQRTYNKRQVVGKRQHQAARSSLSRSKKGGWGVVSIASTMTNLVLLAFMLLAYPVTSLEIGDMHAILGAKNGGKSCSIMSRIFSNRT